jgi:phosphate transport system protein
LDEHACALARWPTGVGAARLATGDTMRHFHEQLHALLKQLVLMGTTAEEMIHEAVRCLVERDERGVEQIYRREHDVNRLQMEVDDAAVRLTALQQPVAQDVRFLFMASRIASELERIADQAINIAQSAHHVLAHPPLRPMVDVPIMAEIAQQMVRQSITAIVERDVALADWVLEEERKVDAFKDQIFRTLLTYMMADPATIQWAVPTMLISRNLERIGDHATNIAEEVIYMVQGRDIRHPADAPPRPWQRPDAVNDNEQGNDSDHRRREGPDRAGAL